MEIQNFSNYSDSQKTSHASSNEHVSVKPGFIVRIELHGITDATQYIYLYDELNNRGFQEFVLNEKREPFALPRATYYYGRKFKDQPSSEIHKLANEAVKTALNKEPLASILKANKDATILVVRTDSVYWTGLKPHEPQ